jgi:hypothetical protein
VVWLIPTELMAEFREQGTISARPAVSPAVAIVLVDALPR